MSFHYRNRRVTSIFCLFALLFATTATPAAAEYDPRTGRFLQPDQRGMGVVLQPSLPYHAANPTVTVWKAYELQYGDGMNFYEYLRSGPPNSTDPSGMWSYSEIAASVAIQGTMGGFINGFVCRMAGEEFWEGFDSGAIGGALGGGTGFAFTAGRAGFFGSVVLGRLAEGFVESASTSFYSHSDFSDALVEGLMGAAIGAATGGLMSAGGRGISAMRTLRAATPGTSVLDTAARKGIWSINPTVRGLKIERHLAVTEYAGWWHVGALEGGFYPLIDFQKGTKFVSVKSVDTRTGGWLSRVRKHIQELGQAEGISNGRPGEMILDLRVQPGGAADAQQLSKCAQQHRVSLIVKEF